MPKKKPIDKRLNKLFTDINPEQAQTDPKAGSVERAPDAFLSSPLENVPTPEPRESSQVIKSMDAPGSSTMSLAFQTGQNTWATLQVMDEKDER